MALSATVNQDFIVASGHAHREVSGESCCGWRSAGRTGPYRTDTRLLARGCGLKADTEPCGMRFSSRCCCRGSESLRAALTDCLLSYRSMARGAMIFVRRSLV